jgi:hypothetical protein
MRRFFVRAGICNGKPNATKVRRELTGQLSSQTLGEP